jgi:hypothetical protein
MGEMKSTYKGYELWLYEKGEKTSQKVWVAKTKGKRPEISEFRKTKKGIKNLITETLNKPPAKVETYKGVEIFYIAKNGKYEASVGSKKRKSSDLKRLRKWVENQKK